MNNTFDLSRNEKQLWSGVPRQGLMLRASDAFLIPFSLMWGGFAIFWEISALRMGGPGFFALWGIPFVLIGLYIIVGRFFVDRFQRARTTYELTSQRVVIRRGGNTQSLALATLSDINLKESANGLGTITFGGSSFPANNFFAAGSWPGTKGPPMFEQIPEARSIFDQIRNAQQTAIGSRA